MASAKGSTRGTSWKLLVGSVVLGVAPFALMSGGSTSATASAGDSSGTTAVVECSSGTITQGDVQTSSLLVVKVPASSIPDTPGGCTVRRN
jgi:hypothetical protein